MSFQKNDEALDKAFELIETDHLEEARAILKPILDTQKDNPDVWWLYAHAVTDPETARLALNNVQRLDPNYLNTGDLLYALENRSSAGASSESGDKEPSFLPPVPSTLPDMPQVGKKTDDDDSEWNAFDEDDEEDSVPLFRRPVFLMVVGLLIFLVIAAVVILNPPPQSPTNVVETVAPTAASSVAEIPTLVVETLVPTDSSSSVQVPTVENVVPTGEVPTLEPATSTIPAIETTPASEGGFDDILTALSAFELPDQAVNTEATSLGNTLVVSVCTEAGSKLRQALPAVIDAFITQFQSVPADLDGAGIRMLDCASNTTLLMIGVPSEDIRAYADGSLDKTAMQAKWQPLN